MLTYPKGAAAPDDVELAKTFVVVRPKPVAEAPMAGPQEGGSAILAMNVPPPSNTNDAPPPYSATNEPPPYTEREAMPMVRLTWA